MRCEQAQELFGAYLNGELAGSLATELGAHRVQCADCRRALALMEVSGQIVASDRDPVTLRQDFTDRLLACVEPHQASRTLRWRRRLYVAGPLAAAAVVALAFFGVFDNRETQVAGTVEKGIPKANETEGPAVTDLPAEDLPVPPTGDERLLQELAEQTRRNLEAKRQSGESLQQHLDLTARQLMEMLNEADQKTDETKPPPVKDEVKPPAPESTDDPTDDSEDP